MLALRADAELAGIPRLILGDAPAQVREEHAIARPLRRDVVLDALAQQLRPPLPLSDVIVTFARWARRDPLDRALAGRRWRVHDAPDLAAVEAALARGADALLLDLGHPQAAEIAELAQRVAPKLPLIGLGERRDPGAALCSAVLPTAPGSVGLVLDTLNFERLAAAGTGKTQ